MPPELIPDDGDYASEEDSDFAPDGALAAEAEDSSDEEPDDAEQDTTTKPTRPKKRKRGDDEEAEDAGIENSGDEAIIGDGLKRDKKRRKEKKGLQEEDEGGEGGLVKTRSMRAQEKVEMKPLASTAAATINVDAVWAAMISGKPAAPAPQPKPITEPSLLIPNRSLSPDAKRTLQNSRLETRSPSILNDGPDSMIMIKRTYNFAGRVHTEQKLVARNSAEAKLFLASNPPPSTATVTEPTTSPFTKPKRPLKKARRSVFDTMVIDVPARTDLFFGERREAETKLVGGPGEKVKSFNTVEKSAMDWAGFVDKEGIADELDAAGKSKGAYRARQEFLARAELRVEEDSRRARGLPV